MPSPSIPSVRSAPAPLAACLRVLLAALSVSGAIVLPAPCRAAEADDVQRAREHHKAGDQAFKEGRYQDAYKEWEAGYNLSPRPLFLLNMAHAERRRGELKNARTLYRRFLLMEPQSRLRGEVESVLAEIDAALAEAPETAPAPQPEGAPVAPPTVVTTPPPPDLLGSPGEPAIGPPSFVSTALPPADPEPTARPLYKRWWFWTGIGVVAAAAGGASFFLLRGDGYTKMGSLGTVGAP
jgi:tetratricopeptide (TPR) repeat protein